MEHKPEDHLLVDVLNPTVICVVKFGRMVVNLDKVLELENVFSPNISNTYWWAVLVQECWELIMNLDLR